MSQVELHPFEAVLRMCADAAPNPWRPERYARRSGVPLRDLNAILKQLWDQGLLEKAPGDPEDGPGLRLSNKGWQVVNDRQALQRLCANDGFASDPRPGAGPIDARRKAVFESLRSTRRPYVTWLMLAVNLLVFLAGGVLAYQKDVLLSYLGGQKTLIASAVFLGLFVAFNVRAIARYLDTTVRLIILVALMVVLYKVDLFAFPVTGAAAEIRHQSGLLTAADWLRGEWWRALTACFVHLGLLHVMTNMMVLFNGGRFIERMWGAGPFLVIYLLSGVTGSVAGLAGNAGGVAGASGALCGIIAAEAVWVMLNGKYLPPQVHREWMNNLSLNFMLLVAISAVPGVSGWGHAGGALAGAAAAVCLHFRRFGPPVWRWAALLGLAAIPFAGLALLNRERHRDPNWAAAEEKQSFEKEYKHSLNHPITNEMRDAFAEKVRPVLVDKHPKRRERAETDEALAVLAEQRQELESWLATLNKLGPYDNKETEEKRWAALNVLKDRIDLYVRMEACLRAGEQFPAREEKALMDRIAATPELQTADDRAMAEARRKADEERQAREKRDRDPKAEWQRQKDAALEEDKFIKEYLRPKILPPIDRAYKLYEDDLKALLDHTPKDRVPQTVAKNLPQIDARRKELTELVEWLPTLRDFKTEDVVTQIERSKAYATEFANLLETVKRCLQAGDKWTDEEKAALKKQEEKVAELRKVYQELLP
jgi:membrane associated rhomboid family serine protease